MAREKNREFKSTKSMESYNFASIGRVVMASSIQEAEKILKEEEEIRNKEKNKKEKKNK